MLSALDLQPDGRIETVAVTMYVLSFFAGEVLTTDAVNVITERLNLVEAPCGPCMMTSTRTIPPARMFCTFSSRS